jgi:hypothetical protein
MKNDLPLIDTVPNLVGTTSVQYENIRIIENPTTMQQMPFCRQLWRSRGVSLPQIARRGGFHVRNSDSSRTELENFPGFSHPLSFYLIFVLGITLL